MRFVRWCGVVILLWIGVVSAIALLRYAKIAAADETFCFSANYTAARLAIFREANGNLQDWDWFRAQTRRYGFKVTDVFWGNPPSAALTMAPVAFLPHPQARAIWTWASLLFWIAGVGLLGTGMVRYAGGSLLAAAPALFCWAMLFEPVRSNLEVAHVYVFAFFLQSIGCWLWLARRSAWAGAVIGALLALKGYGVVLIVLSILRRDWKFTAAAAGSFLSLATLAGVLLGFRQWIEFVLVQRGASFSGTPTPALQTVKSLLILALHLPLVQNGPVPVLVPWADHLWFVFQAVSLGAILWWLSEWRIARGEKGRSAISAPSPAVLSVCVLLNLVFAPRGEDHAYPLAMTALLLMIPELRQLSSIAIGIILGGVLLSWPFHLQDRTVVTSWELVADFARLWGAIILLIAALWSEYHRRRDVQPQRDTWAGAYWACSLGIVLVLWYSKPWRDPVKSGPLLAVSQTRGNTVTLVRLDLEERDVSTIPVNCQGPFGLAFSRSRSWLYTTCSDSSQISLIDLVRRRESKVFPGEHLPAWVNRRDGTDELWISNEGTGTVSIYRAGTSTVLGEVATGAGPSDIVFTSAGRRAWVSNEKAGNVSLLDATNRRKIRDIPVGNVPQGIALTRAADRLLVANFQSNTVSVLDTVNLRELGQIPVCEGPVDVATARTGDHELGYVTCFDGGSVSVIDMDRFKETQRISVGGKPYGIIAHPNGKRVYVCIGESNRLVVLETGSPSRVIRRMKMDGNPLQIAIVP